MQDKVKELLLGAAPCSIGKMGNVELMHFYPTFFYGRVSFAGNMLAVNAGLNFKDNKEYFIWVEDYARALNKIDCLLAWNHNDAEERIVEAICKKPLIVENFPDIEPFSHGKEGWHYELADKRVLVISSFKDSIEAQIPNFSKIWPEAQIGAVEVIKMPQPHQITGDDTVYYNDVMWGISDQISSQNFDICIIGAGGYSLPLCNFVKSIGKRAIHLGGATQVLFGIRGSRFDRNFADQLWYGTDAFIRPLKSDIPKFHNLVEGSCYW